MRAGSQQSFHGGFQQEKSNRFSLWSSSLQDPLCLHTNCHCSGAQLSQHQRSHGCGSNSLLTNPAQGSGLRDAVLWEARKHLQAALPLIVVITEELLCLEMHYTSVGKPCEIVWDMYRLLQTVDLRLHFLSQSSWCSSSFQLLVAAEWPSHHWHFKG